MVAHHLADELLVVRSYKNAIFRLNRGLVVIKLYRGELSIFEVELVDFDVLINDIGVLVEASNSTESLGVLRRAVNTRKHR